MTSLSDDNQADIMEAFNSTSRYLDEFLNIYTSYFEGMVNQIYPPELQMNKSNRKAMNRNWSNQKANPALKTKAGNK